jgi:hypothetical protein
MSKISELILEGGRARAQGQLARGAGLNSAIQTAAGFLPAVTAREDALKQQRQADADRALRTQTAQSQLATDALQRTNIQSEIDTRNTTAHDQEDARKLAARTAKVQGFLTDLAGVTDPEQQKAAYAEGVARLSADGTLDQGDMPNFFPGQSFIRGRLMQTGMALDKMKALGLLPEEQKPMEVAGALAIPDGHGGFTFQRPPEAPKTPEPFTLGEGQVRYGADGQVLARGPAKREPQGAQPTFVTLSGPNGQQVQVPQGEPANVLLRQGWKLRDATADRQVEQKTQATAAAASTRQQIRDLAQGLIDDPALDHISGPIAGRTVDILPGSVDAARRLQQLTSLLSLESRSKLKGQGAVSDFEGKMLSNSVSAIDRRAGASNVKKHLQEIVTALAGDSPKAGDNVPAGAGLSLSVQTPDGQTFNFASPEAAEAFKRSAGIK